MNDQRDAVDGREVSVEMAAVAVSVFPPVDV